jgi:hypothetical protein
MGLKLPTADTNFKQKQAQLAKFASNIWTLMGNATGVANFPAPPILLVDLIVIINNYTSSLATAHKGSKDDTSNKNIAKQALIAALRAEAAYVTQQSQAQSAGGDANRANISMVQQFILTSGFKLSKVPSPVGDVQGIALPIVKKAISKESGTMHLLLRNYTRYKKGVKTWQLQYRTSEVGETPAGPWITQTFTSGNITAEGLTSGTTYDWQVAAVGGHNTRLNVQNQINYTSIRKIVIT